MVRIMRMVVMLSSCGGTELQKDEHHGIGKIPFGIELGAVEKYKQKGHGKVQQNTKGQVEGGHLGKEAQ